MNTVDSLDLAIRALRGRRNTDALKLKSFSPSTTGRNAKMRTQARINAADQAIITLTALMAMIEEQATVTAGIRLPVNYNPDGHNIVARAERLHRGEPPCLTEA